MSSSAVVTLLVGLVLGVAVGAVAAWFVARSRAAATTSDVDAHLADARAEADRARAEASQARADLSTQRALEAQAAADLAEAHAMRSEVQGELVQVRSEAQVAVAEARSELARLQAELATAVAEKKAALEQVEAMKANEAHLVDQFKLLSSEQLAQQGKVADAAAVERQKAVDALVTPLTQQLKDFQSRLTEMEKERLTLSTELREQVRQVSLTGDNLRRETAALTTALRKPQVRGQWGELQLKRAVEVAGMLEHCNFTQQTTSTTSSDATIRPDMTVMLSEDKFVHVDSKVPLTAFLDAQEAAEDAERERLMTQFTRNVRSHVDQLSSKQYWKSDAGTPEFTVMFIPSEALAAEALSRMPDLLTYASGKGIVLATPTSLIGLLKTVAYSWRQAALADNAKQVFDLARELYERLGTMGTHMSRVGKALDSAVKAYNSTVGSLETRVLPTARKLHDLNLADKELETLVQSETAVRQLSAPELAAEIEAPTELDAGQAQLELTRGEPTTEEILEQTTPAARAAHLRSLG